MYRPLTVVVIVLFTSSLRNSAGIPNLDDDRIWFSIIDPAFSQSFLVHTSKVILMTLPKKSTKVEKEAGTNAAVKVEPLPLTASVNKEKEIVWRE